jgi:hypothetical protein
MPERKWKLDEGPFGQYLLICEDALIKTIGVDLATARKVAAFEEMYEALQSVRRAIMECPEDEFTLSLCKTSDDALRLADTGKE